MLSTTLNNDLLSSRLTDSLNYFLIEISGKLQLTKTQREKAEGHYQAIANVLKGSPPGTLLNELDIEMKPFGGLGTNTAVSPFKKDEFDLDIIIQFMATIGKFSSAKDLYFEVYDRLNGLDSYKDRIEKMPRCIRVYYAGEFYLDVMPAALLLPFPTERPKLHIAEKQSDGSYKYVLVDPLGLMHWFEEKCRLQKKASTKVLNERADFEIMPLASPEAIKPALKQANQLIKRARDIYFYNDDDCKKILKSVLILTVSGNCYAGESDLYTLVAKVIHNLDFCTQNLATSRVYNPMNQSEDFLESLRKYRSRYDKLRGFIEFFNRMWVSLADRNLSLNQRTAILNKLFGESVTQEVLKDYGTRMDEQQRRGGVRMTGTGLLGLSKSVGAMVPRHQFYGSK